MSHFKEKRHDFHVIVDGKRNRTPLINSIRLELSMKTAEVRGLLKSKQKKYISTIVYLELTFVKQESG